MNWRRTGRSIGTIGAVVFGVLGFHLTCSASGLTVDETPAEPSEWGFRPAEGFVSQRTPASFSWRPQADARSYTLQVARDDAFDEVIYEAEGLTFTVHTPPEVFEPGAYHWRFRYENEQAVISQWSGTRQFAIDDEAIAFPLAPIDELVRRIPDGHPRLFVRPEQMPELRAQAEGELASIYEAMVEQAEELLADPPDTEEPPKYPEGVEVRSSEWRSIWWGNRRLTRAVLENAATLGFVYQLSGNETYGQLARELLMDAAAWDPEGSTSYGYNSEAGMPYIYFFSRTYTFINDLLTEEERQRCREVIRIRGNEIYDVLYPRHLWEPYASHRNRAWHFMGEAAIAFIDEIDEAEDWLWLAMNIFANNYPVWNDEYGGWHEGIAYWRSYLPRFTWWADVMQAALDINAYEVLPFFSRTGYYPMYLLPPGTKGGMLGDQSERVSSQSVRGLMSILASQSQNPYWQWYVDVNGGAPAANNYIGFVRGATEPAASREPADLPSSRAFWGIGQAFLNTNLLDASDNVQVLFKSSPMGTRSHGFEAQNSFILQVAGEPVLLRSGERDTYGSLHHRAWMWHTRSTNSITVNRKSQYRRSARAVGELTAFYTSDRIDFVEGEAGQAYIDDVADRFTRAVLFVKPDLVVIFDRLSAPEPVTYEWWLHSPVPMERNGQRDIHVVNEKGASHVAFLYPDGLSLDYTDRFPNTPRFSDGRELVQYHLTASITNPSSEAVFVTALRPHMADEPAPTPVTLEEKESVFVIRTETGDGQEATVLLRKPDFEAPVQAEGIRADAEVAVVLRDAAGQVLDKAAFGGAETVDLE